MSTFQSPPTPILKENAAADLTLVFPQAANRLWSLDAFRGLVIVVMFVVNVGGNDPALPDWFPHRGWANGSMGNGLADFVFPCFLFIVGASIPFSMRGGRGRATSFSRRAAGAFIRGLKIYLLGTLIWCASIAYTQPITASVFLHWDILPLIGFGYFVCVLLSHAPRWAQIAAVVAVLAFKWAILTQVPTPPGSAVVWTDKASFQQYINSNLGWFGVLLTQGMAAAATTQLGSLAGQHLVGDASPADRVRQCRALLLGGALTLAASYIWHAFGGLPYSKDFFTSSYILCAAGTSSILLAALLYVVDVKHWTSLTFLRAFGTNALFIYLLAELTWKCVMMKWKLVTPDGGDSILIASAKAWVQWLAGSQGLGTWLFIISYILLYWLAAHALYRRGWFIKV